MRDPDSALTFRTGSPGETERLGLVWGAVLEPGDVIVLTGDLGTGKTTLVRGLAAGLGVDRGVKSPTFALHLTYAGRVPLHHLDLYRVTEPRDLDELGLDDVLGRDGVTVLEWGERLDPEPDWVRVRIRQTGPESREWEVTGPPLKLAALKRAAAEPA